VDLLNGKSATSATWPPAGDGRAIISLQLKFWPLLSGAGEKARAKLVSPGNPPACKLLECLRRCDDSHAHVITMTWRKKWNCCCFFSSSAFG
jgi:hypothetical protein